MLVVVKAYTMCPFYTPYTADTDSSAIAAHISCTAYIACASNDDYLALVFYNPHIANKSETTAIVSAAHNDLNGYASSISYYSYTVWIVYTVYTSYVLTLFTLLPQMFLYHFIFNDSNVYPVYSARHAKIAYAACLAYKASTIYVAFFARSADTACFVLIILSFLALFESFC